MFRSKGKESAVIPPTTGTESRLKPIKRGFAKMPMLFLSLLFFGLSSCSKDMDDELSLLGSWIEEAPVENRTELFFHSSSRLSRISEGGPEEDFSYRIEDDAIFLWPEGTLEEEGASELFFREIDENTFQIENLYPSIPENEPTFMIFKRQGREF